MREVTVALSQGVIVSMLTSPRHTRDIYTNFFGDLTPATLRFESMNTLDEHVYYSQIDGNHTAVFYRPDGVHTYVLIFLGLTGEARKWAGEHRFEFNYDTNVITAYLVEDDAYAQWSQEIQALDVSKKRVKKLFGGLKDDDLFELGVPEARMGYVRLITYAEDVDKLQNMLPDIAVKNLRRVAQGEGVYRVLRDPHVIDPGEITDTPGTDSYVQQVRDMYLGPLDAWRISLHPQQSELVNKDYAGPAQLLGAAGTGKTIVALHRGRRLAQACKRGEKVLVTAFSKTLTGDMAHTLEELCTPEEYSHIEVINIDAWVHDYLIAHNAGFKVVYSDARLNEIWNEAAARTGVTNLFALRKITAPFLMKEWRSVISPRNIASSREYEQQTVTADGKPLSNRERVAIWKVVNTYKYILEQEKIRDIYSAMDWCAQDIASKGKKSIYKNIIVDEGQDLSAAGFRLLRALAGEVHANDILVAGDAHQRIFGHQAVLSQCGIDIDGRVDTLSVAYRTAKKTMDYANTLLRNATSDDMNGGLVDNISLGFREGSTPVIVKCENELEQFNTVAEQIYKLVIHGARPRDICVVARKRKIVTDCKEALCVWFDDHPVVKKKAKNRTKIETLILDNATMDDRTVPGVRVTTMNRVKGLEFDYVFVVDVSEGIMPTKSALKDALGQEGIEQVMITEASLLYVALTRARISAWITYQGQPSRLLVVN